MKLRVARKVLKRLDGPPNVWLFNGDEEPRCIEYGTRAAWRRDGRWRRRARGYRVRTVFAALDRGDVGLLETPKRRLT